MPQITLIRLCRKIIVILYCQEPASRKDTEDENNVMVFKETKIKNIKEVTEPLKEEILKGDVHTIEEMKAWLKSFGYSEAINDAAINFFLREFVMSKVSCDEMRKMDMIVELLRPQLEVTKEDIEPVIIMGLYHHRDLVGSPGAFIKVIKK